MPWYISALKSIPEMAANAGGMILGAKFGGKAGAIIGFLSGGALTGTAISALWQKHANGEIDKKQLLKDAAFGSIGF